MDVRTHHNGWRSRRRGHHNNDLMDTAQRTRRVLCARGQGLRSFVIEDRGRSFSYNGRHAKKETKSALVALEGASIGAQGVGHPPPIISLFLRSLSLHLSYDAA